MSKAYLTLALIAAAAFTFATDIKESQRQVGLINPEAVQLALADMALRWPDQCPTPEKQIWLTTLPAERDALFKRLAANDATAIPAARALCEQVRKALTSLPLLPDLDLIAVERGANNLALPANWENLHEVNRKGLQNRVIRISGIKTNPTITPIWQPPYPNAFAGRLQLHWDADRLMLTSNNQAGKYRVYELSLNNPVSGEPPQFSQIDETDVDNYSGCWLADDNYLFLSTATMIGVPCVRGASHIANIYKFDHAQQSIRRLTFEQEHNWCPTMLADGSVMYLRWEYSDIPHYVARILFTMNPDGTTQREFYGSNSYWPNSMFHAKPIPDDPHRFVAVISGHHDTNREGELILFDTTRGRHEASGVVQRIPGRGKAVEPKILDGLVQNSWPRFLYPYPLGDNYFLASCKPGKDALWGIYLVDIFDNMTLLYESPGQAILEATIVQKRQRPPLRPSLIEPGQPARVKIIDIYQGPGLAGIPRGTVKSIRVISYAFSYRGMGGQVDRVGLDGPWDVKRILGTVPVATDGSAFFEVPANTPVALQPLDAKGRALQLMRSWITVMPGELQSCSGCHESQNTGPGPRQQLTALKAKPAQIKPWYGPARGFSFNREVQPVLNQACVKCHNGARPERPDFTERAAVMAGSKAKYYDENARFPPAYLALRSYVRGPTIESDMHLLTPCEYHASTTELIQILEGGHHGVTLTGEQWDRLHTWIDLHTPAHGTWSEISGEQRTTALASRRREMMQRYAACDEDLEDNELRAAFTNTPAAIATIEYNPPAKNALTATCAPLTMELAERVVKLGGEITMRFVKIPGGSITLSDGIKTTFAKPLWVATHEVSNAQFAQFNAEHDSRIESGDFLQFGEVERGFPCNLPDQPVSHVSAIEVREFCAWLSEKSGLHCRLPTAIEWQWFARAGSEHPNSWQDNLAELNKIANLADKSFNAVQTLGWGLPSGAIPPWRKAALDVDDGFRVCSPTGQFKANAWGLYDTIGNVWEWSADQRADGSAIACGGSWHTRPCNAGFDAQIAYPEWQKVYDIGFRVVITTP
ncbi:MAG: SUMF1/EgtB/PvdO family nonheme iron enzyme [Kiritimatiellae bacterium]|nr:SUMF1/EgtB/PvdO family nonheme iron enzyme [Kiritimatiellia bacterium]